MSAAKPDRPVARAGSVWDWSSDSLHDEDAARPSRSRGDLWRFPWLVYLSWLVILCPLAVVSISGFQWGAVPAVWGASAAVTATVAMVWPRHRRVRWLVVATTVLTPTTLYLIALLVTDLSQPRAIALALTTSLNGWVTAGVILWLFGGRRWTPREPVDLVRLGCGIAVVSSSMTWLGLLPGTHLFAVDPFNFAWAVRTTSFTFIGAIAAPVLWWYPDPWPTWRRDLAWLAVAIPGTTALQWLIYTHRDQPLTWTLLFPAILAGWVLSPRGAAIWVLATALSDMAMALMFVRHDVISGWFPATVLGELLISATSFVCMLIAIFRRQQSLLERFLRRERGQAAGQASLLGGIFDSMTEGVLVVDQEGQVLVVNQAAIGLLGSAPVGRIDEWSARVGLQDIEGAPITRNHPGMVAALAGESSVIELLLAREYGKKWLSVAMRPLTPGPGARVLAVLRDVTADRVKAEELRSFAGVVSHDLRTPLTSLRGWLELLEEELADDPESAGDPVVQRALTAANNGSRRLALVVEDWLTFTVGRDAQLDPVELVLSDLVAEAVEELTPEAVVTIDAPHRVVVDPAFVRQVFANVCGNAVKYRREGVRATVMVTSSVDTTESGRGHSPGFIRVEVRDNGTGIPAGEEQRIFEEFQRSDLLAQRRSGTGLGLALSRRIVERHGGTIRAFANPQSPGSTVVFTLPAAPAAPPVFTRFGKVAEDLAGDPADDPADDAADDAAEDAVGDS